MAIYFSTIPTEWYELEGIYIALLDQPTPVNIQSQGRLVKIVGEFPWGPTEEILEVSDGPKFRDNLLGRAASPEDYGGFRAVAGKQWGELHIVRVKHSGQAKSSATLQDNSPQDAYTITAKHVGAVGDEIQYEHVDQGSSTFDLTITWGNDSVTYTGLTLSTDDLDDGIDNDWVDVTLDNAGASVPADASGNLSGGSDGSPTSTEYESALDILEAGDKGGVVFAAEFADDSFIAKLQTHCANTRALGLAQADSGDDWDTNVTDAAGIADETIAFCNHRVKQYIEGALRTVDLTAFAASALANSPEHISLAAARNNEWLRPIRGYADGVSPIRSDKVSAREAGSLFVEKNDGKWTFVHQLTSDPDVKIAKKRMEHLIAENSARVLQPYQSEPPYPSNVNGAKGQLEDMLEILEGNSRAPDTQMIKNSEVLVIETTPDLVHYKTIAPLWGEMGTIVNSILVGENVEITTE